MLSCIECALVVYCRIGLLDITIKIKIMKLHINCTYVLLKRLKQHSKFQLIGFNINLSNKIFTIFIAINMESSV